MICDHCVYRTKGCSEKHRDVILQCNFYKPEVVYCKDCEQTQSIYNDCCVCKQYGIKELDDFCSEGRRKQQKLTADDILKMSEEEFIKNRELILEFIKQLKEA